MSVIKFDYVIPEKKSEITIEEWMMFDKIYTEDVEPDFLQKKMLEIFCKVPSEYSTKLSQEKVDEMLNKVTILFKQKSFLKQRFNYKGVEWGLIPDFSKHITAGELIDLDSYLEQKDYVKLLSILYRPVIKSSSISGYQIETYTGSHELFKELGYDVLDGVLVFFWSLFKELGKVILKYTKMEVQKMNLTSLEKVNSLLSGEHIQNLFT